MKNRGGL